MNENMIKTHLFLVSRAVSRRNIEDRLKTSLMEEIEALKRLTEETRFREYYFYFKPNFDSNICEQHKTILN